MRARMAGNGRAHGLPARKPTSVAGLEGKDARADGNARVADRGGM
jgi:hypothetical protein